jgi:hypothetical protein
MRIESGIISRAAWAVLISQNHEMKASYKPIITSMLWGNDAARSQAFRI